MWRKEWNAPLGTLVFVTQVGPELHTHTHTHGRRLTAPSGSCAAAGRMKGNTKTTTRERQVASLAAPHTCKHSDTRIHTNTHVWVGTQTPSSSNPLLCTPAKVPNPGLVRLSSFLNASSHCISAPPTMNLSPPFSLRQVLRVHIPLVS